VNEELARLRRLSNEIMAAARRAEMNDDELNEELARLRRLSNEIMAAGCERNTRYTMMAKNVRADHAAQLRPEPGDLIVVLTDMRELT
jgi:hypothetical protein